VLQLQSVIMYGNISLNSFLVEKKCQIKLVEKKLTVVSNIFLFQKSCFLQDNYKKHPSAGKAKEMTVYVLLSRMKFKKSVFI
jgi:hypothetical protein